MKTSRINFPVTVSVLAAVLALTASAALGQSFDSARALKYPALAASPRMIEAFPWLVRESAKPQSATSGAALAAATRNSSFAASPRILEQFPELSRPVQPLRETTVNSAPVVNNSAYAASPRALEQFPWLARGSKTKDSGRTFEIAPLK